ncbi:MAG: hypothetical protein QXP19_02240 [Thermoproteota archaeon]
MRRVRPRDYACSFETCFKTRPAVSLLLRARIRRMRAEDKTRVTSITG